VIGMEGGLLAAPTSVAAITLGPGERADVVIDFAPYPAGTEIVLLNSAPAPFPGQAGVGVIPNVMKFRVTAAPGHTAAVPASLRPFTPLSEAAATVNREFHLEKGPADACSPYHWRITSIVNGAAVGHMWDDVTEFPQLGTTEIWKFANLSGVTHPIHLHLVMFQVLDRQAFEVVNGAILPLGSPVPPPPHEAGWKDTVQVGPNEIVRVIMRFVNPLDASAPTYTGMFPYHCHILEHEDHEMMRQFETSTACGDGVPGLPAEECDDGNTIAGDGCSPTCAVENECQNGIDDDGDGLADFPNDPGCADAADFLEISAALPCDDGLDNDGDTLVDFPADPGCASPLDPTETSPPDSDGDGVADSVDNCPYEPNPTQSDVGGLGAAPPDGIGDACQCGDVNGSGTVTGSDATVLSRAVLNLSPAFSVGGNAACTAAGVPATCCTGPGTGSCDPGLGAAGLAKCNVDATPTPGVAGCTSIDAIVISRALLNLSSPGIAQGCDAAQP
jgi:cysteine-rich repeat protein